jgi:hypothetical protein
VGGFPFHGNVIFSASVAMRTRFAGLCALVACFIAIIFGGHVIWASSSPKVVGPEVSSRLYGSGTPDCVAGPAGANFNYCSCGTVNPQPVGCGGTQTTGWEDCDNNVGESCTYPVWGGCG